MTFFASRGITAELLMFVLSIIMLSVIAFSKPEKTKMLRMVFWGFLLSCVAISANIMIYATSFSLESWNPIVFYASYLIYISSYTVILNLMFVYVDLLSYYRRSQINNIKKMLLVFSIVWMGLMLYPMIADKLIIIDNNSIVLTSWVDMYIYCGLMDGLLIVLTVISNRRSISHIVVVGATICCGIDAIALLGQFMCENAVFTSSTFVSTFLILYILFHCAPYDEISGTQSSESFYARVGEAIVFKKRFLTVTVMFPALQKRDFYDNKELLDYCSSYMCREIERVHRGIGIYSHNTYTYSLFVEEDKSDTEEKIINKITEILTHPIFFKGARIDARFKMVILHDSPRYSRADNVKAVLAYELGRFFPNLENEIIEVDEEELGRVAEKDLIEQLLYDIRNKEDLNDPRVFCFAQPIYCIETNTFRTAEALMRLNLDGEMISPDKFIPVAENNGCIHILTLIILNKVCRFIKEIEKTHEFDAITVNCSTVELDDRNLHKELQKIIRDNGVDPRKIRLEITESLDMTRYENVLYNMKMLNEFGVDFYLDDFGTGYANLERIVSYPFHTIKFDKNILYRAIDDDKADAVLDSMVKLFKDNGFHTIVEGVEDENQSKYVKDKGFGHIQGYMYSKPLEISELKDYFSRVIV